MAEQVVGNIQFGNTREGCALSTIHEALIDKRMWMYECDKKDEEIERLKAIIADLQKGIRKRHGKVKRS